MIEKLYSRPFPRNGETCARCPTPRDCRSPLCRPCRSEQRKTVRRQHRASERGRATTKAYVTRTRERQKEYHQRYIQRHDERVIPKRRATTRRVYFAKQLARFGITADHYHELAEKGCRLCGGQDTSGKRLSMDHDHATGKFRGLLCGTCNTRLGWFERRRQAIEEYIA